MRDFRGARGEPTSSDRHDEQAAVAAMHQSQQRADTRPTTAQPVLQAIALTKSFGDVVANHGVSFDLRKGEIHALLGENGSGKTTLCKLLTGMYRPDSGEIVLDGHPVVFHSPRDAHEAGLFMVHQHFSLVERLSVAENVVLGLRRDRSRLLRRGLIEEEVRRAAEQFAIALDPSTPLWKLSVWERQRVEILKALYRGTRILILDEPTAVLTPQETAALSSTLIRMAEEGMSIVFISHKLNEVLELCDRVTVLRGGVTLSTTPLKATDVDVGGLARLMVGEDSKLPEVVTRRTNTRDVPVLELKSVSVHADLTARQIRDVTFTVHRGEVLALAGVAGNGQRELADAIAGLHPIAEGEILLEGKPLPSGDVRARIVAGLTYVPEDRNAIGLATTLTVADNLILRHYRTARFSRGLIIRRREVTSHAVSFIARFNVRTRPEAILKTLSGGNAQKVLVGRELVCEPTLLVVASPTRGLDILGAEVIRGLIRQAADQGAGVLLISEDLDEVLNLADRIAVVYRGEIVGVLTSEPFSRETIGRLMAGLTI